MNCIKCGSANNSIVDTRYFPDGDYRRRRYYCRDCGKKWTRYEISEDLFYRLKQIESEAKGEKSWWSKIQDNKDKKAAKKAELAEIRRKAGGK